MAKRRRDRAPRAGRAPRHVAHRPGTAPKPEQKRERSLPGWVLPVAAIVGAIIVVAGIGAYIGYRQATGGGGSESSASATTPTATTPTRTAPVKPQTAAALFDHNCSVCHNLRAAGSTTGVGPDLDQIRPTRAQVLQQIRSGSLDGIMQPNLVTGADAQRVAAYVAAVAGRSGQG